MLEVAEVVKTFAGIPVLRGVSLCAAAGEIVALLGPSGCGKTTMLRIIAGLEQADAGVIYFAGKAIDVVPVHLRGFGMMFQDYALFPHRNVADNVAFGLRMQRLPKNAITDRVVKMLELVGLRGYEHRRVYELSGGERQRVALARALAPRPHLLMLDEPLAALDRALRERLQDELGAILRQVGVTSLYVTHDQQEAFALADRVILLNAGAVVQEGPPEVVYRRPASIWAARFLGLPNIIMGVVRADGSVETLLGTLACQTHLALAPQSRVTLVIYPDAALSHAAEAAPGTTVVQGVLIEQQFRGRFYRVRLRHASGIELSLEAETPLRQAGDTVSVCLQAERVYALAERDNDLADIVNGSC
ncbi:MAG: ABC transporter ATP-binding protein [Chloroflexales bacterium]|nr:ABC transporter ATP-binding protein [Chloroflexales bacterium]